MKRSRTGEYQEKPLDSKLQEMHLNLNTQALTEGQTHTPELVVGAGWAMGKEMC